MALELEMNLDRKLIQCPRYLYDISVCRNKDFYGELVHKNPNLKNYTTSQLRSHIKGMNKMIGEAVVENREGVSLPEYMGIIIVATYGKRTKAVDWKSTKELGKVVHHTNTHSSELGGWMFYVRSTNRYNFINSQMWVFEPSWDMRDKIAKAYRENWNKFIRLANFKYVENFIKNPKLYDYLRRKEEKELSKYDEFEGIIDM